MRKEREKKRRDQEKRKKKEGGGEKNGGFVTVYKVYSLQEMKSQSRAKLTK